MKCSMFFPRLARGHGCARSETVVECDIDSQPVRWFRKPNPAWHCASDACVTHGKGKREKHHDRAANIEAWRKERGMR